MDQSCARPRVIGLLFPVKKATDTKSTRVYI